jgi:hypothetical protein
MANIHYIFSLVTLTLFVNIKVSGQTYTGGDPGKGSQMSTVPGGIVQEFGLTEPNTVGNTYLYDDWLMGDIVLSDDKSIKNLPLRYDLYNNGVEIKTIDQIKFIPGIRVKKIDLYLVTGEVVRLMSPLPIIRVNPNVESTFLEVQTIGVWSLYKQTYLAIIKGNYNAALDLGERDNKIIKKSKYIIIKEDKVVLVEMNKKKFSKNFENQKEVFSFLKDRRLNLKYEEDLHKLLAFLNGY